jgi:hypothetical protein
VSLSDLAALGSFVSGVAVLASLVFLYFQMRQVREQLAQTEKNQRTVINESYASRAGEALRWLADDANTNLMTRVTQGERSFTAQGLQRLGIIFRAMVLNTVAATQHYEAGLMDRVSYDLVLLSFKSYLAQPVYRVIWAEQAAMTPPSFSQLVEEWIEATPLAAPSDIAARFDNDLAKLLAEGGVSGAPHERALAGAQRSSQTGAQANSVHAPSSAGLALARAQPKSSRP